MAGSGLMPLRCAAAAGRLRRCYLSAENGLDHVQNSIRIESARRGYSCWRSSNDVSSSSNKAPYGIFRNRNFACRAHTTSSEASSGSSDCNKGSPEFIWRTTERRFIDFCLSPEDEKRLLRLHEKIVTSPWVSITEKEVSKCLLPAEQKEEELQQLSFFQKLRSVANYLLSPRGLEEEGRRLLCTAIPLFDDVSWTKQNFGIGQAQYNARIYFLLLHLWLLHCALQQKVSEFKVPSILRDQQFVSLGFCVALDEAFEDGSAGPAGQLAHRLWVTVYEADEDKRECPELIALTTYAMRARSFALQLPREVLIQGAFSGRSSLSSSSNSNSSSNSSSSSSSRAAAAAVAVAAVAVVTCCMQRSVRQVTLLGAPVI
ncbi:hypothetical protein Emed_002974 [Eimeria media]